MDKQVLQAALADYFAPWVQELGLRVDDIGEDSVTLRIEKKSA